MNDHTPVRQNAKIQATEAPNILNKAVDIKTPSRSNNASKRASKNTDVISVSVDHTILYS